MSEVFEYYEKIKSLARQKKRLYLREARYFGLREINKIYTVEGIKISYRDSGGFQKLKAAYFHDVDGVDVIINKKLPSEVRLFALIHELKHHYTDSDRLKGIVACYDEKPLVEKSAEVFAAEFIWPESMFLNDLRTLGITKINCSPQKIVQFKRQFNMPVKYKFIRKRLEWFGIIAPGEYADVKFVNLEYEIFGLPVYLKYR